MISFNFQCDCMRELVSFVLFFRESSRFVETKQAKHSNAGTLTRLLALTAGTLHCRTAVVWGLCGYRLRTGKDGGQTVAFISVPESVPHHYRLTVQLLPE